MSKDAKTSLKPSNFCVKAVVDSVTKPVRGLFEKILGPVAEEIENDLRGRYQNCCRKRGDRLLSQTTSMVIEAQFEPVAVSRPLLINIFDNGSIQDDADLQDRWAALLASAANPETVSRVLPSFPEILRQLSPVDAKLLDILYDNALCHQVPEGFVPLGHEYHGIAQLYRCIVRLSTATGQSPMN